MRNRLQEPRFRSGYVEDKFEVYLELMRLQLQQGSTADAFSTAERLRARSFGEQIGGRASVPFSASERRTDAELRERVRQLQRTLADSDNGGASAYPERAMDRFSLELQSVESEYQTFLDDHARIQDPAGVVSDASSIQRRLAADQALIEYVVGPESLFVFVLTSRGMTVKSSPLREPDLTARIALLRDLIRRPADDRGRKSAARLAADLFDPIERAGWLDGVTRLYIVPHGALAYLPFALLPQPASGRGDLLIGHHIVAYLPSAGALLRDSSGPDTDRSLLAVAPSRGGLRHAPEEARAIHALIRGFVAAAVMPGQRIP